MKLQSVLGRPTLINLPFFIAGTLQMTYDVLLYRAFVAVHPPEEIQGTTSALPKQRLS